MWPPVLAGPGPLDLSGIDAAAVGTVLRSDGGTQLTIGGWPVYRFAKDSAPGDITGQGVFGSWYAVTPAGKKATATSAPIGWGSGHAIE